MAGRRRCPICGGTFLAIDTHLSVRHGVTPEDRLLSRVMGVPLLVFTTVGDKEPEKASQPAEDEPLEVAVARQVAELTASADDIVGTRGAMDDRQRPAPDLTRYADAFASAAAACDHPYPVDLITNRQYHCPDCNRTFGIDELRRTRGWM